MKPLCNSTPSKSTTEKCQVNLGSHEFYFFNWYFRIENVLCFWTSFISGFPKCHLCLSAGYRNAQNCSLKNYVIKNQFLGYMFAKCRYINLKFGMPDVQVCCTTYRTFLKILSFWFKHKYKEVQNFHLWEFFFFENPRYPL